VNTGTFDEVYPILVELSTEGEVTTGPPPDDEASAG
jgi:hypothetical protein